MSEQRCAPSDELHLRAAAPAPAPPCASVRDPEGAAVSRPTPISGDKEPSQTCEQRRDAQVAVAVGVQKAAWTVGAVEPAQGNGKGLHEDEEDEHQKRLHQASKDQRRKEAVAAFLLKHHFHKGVCGPKRSFFRRTTYPLHCAAKLAMPGMVEMLLVEGADPIQKDSKGHTAVQVARRHDTHGSHTLVLRLLTKADFVPTRST